MNTRTHAELVNFIWGICNLLRGPYKRNEYRKVILPLTVLRRFDCVLAETKDKVLAADASYRGGSPNVRQGLLEAASGRPFYNTSKLNFERLLNDPSGIAQNLSRYIRDFSENVFEIMQRFGFDEHIARMHERNLLYQVIQRFARIDLSPARVDNVQMGYVFEELIRIGAEQANEEAGEHFTPREVIRLMVSLLLSPEPDLGKSHVVKTIYDPACGTGGMLSVAEEYIREHNREARPLLYGQDWNDEAWAVCRSDMLIKGENAENVILGDSFSQDGYPRGGNSSPPLDVRLHARKSALRRGMEAAAAPYRARAGHPRVRRTLRRRAAEDQRRLAAVLAAHAVKDAAPQRGRRWRQPNRHRLQRLAPVHRRRWQRREQHPPVDHRARLAGGNRGVARSALLQHRHLNLCVGADESQGAPAEGQGAAHRRAPLLREDAQEPREQAQRALASTDR